MDKRILLPTDFSKNALNAVRYALKLYADHDCNFYFLHVFPVDGYHVDNPIMLTEPDEKAFEKAKKNSEDEFKKLMKTLQREPENPKHRYHTISTNDSLIESTKDLIRKKDIDIIIMGTQGTTGSRTVIFGTNTINMMEAITVCPVLSIPEFTNPEPPNEIVFPTDYKSVFKRRELKHLMEISRMHNIGIRILHIEEEKELSKEQQESKDLLESIFKELDHSFHTLSDVKVHAGINAFIESRDSEMIAFLNKKSGFFHNILSKPLVQELGYHSKIPVLALNDVL
ncbi:universal stress protein [Pricia sp. S334]|uniref:Universal stress protein n=1 Tax=Pricia mediterranea TaxID=3076079 RepID=A0ABU3L1X8_9FLAO|nr:universal stress protein [Pricia sp. S334]MDT7827413.1 universal stress protein [Pricia sp. S334]